jgi:hypothetical protein
MTPRRKPESKAAAEPRGTTGSQREHGKEINARAEDSIEDFRRGRRRRPRHQPDCRGPVPGWTPVGGVDLIAVNTDLQALMK